MKQILFISIREQPEYVEPLLATLGEHWWGCMPWTRKHMEQCLRTTENLPDTYVMLEDGKLVGMYTLLIKELFCSKETGLWVGTLYILPEARGRRLSPLILEHARIRAGELGYDEIYLASDHIQYYEKFGFQESGPDLCAWGEETKMYVNDALFQEEKKAA